MTRTRSLALLLASALAVLVAVAITPAVRAEIPATATYTGTDELGVVTVTAPAGTRYQIYAEQADGTYTFAAGGTLSCTGAASVTLAPSGVIGNGTPMFVVKVSNTAGEVLWLSVPISENDDYLWGWL